MMTLYGGVFGETNPPLGTNSREPLLVSGVLVEEIVVGNDRLPGVESRAQTELHPQH